ncbi:ABC transporter permease [Thalassospira xiamenensis]|uniref:ABC-2 type transporter transmembrane domain-containing protein n=1 Tax=Thalassospira xiamenensis TaxID=220697 RepID=A0ABR5Y5Q1_9PROT|nr:ABC transporter permease [Thalassospira xiamenensis]KZD05697.1 hypothetical protein AUP40_11865 [Thalassospira xiamenensis]KZD09619.1 hypothetical protein AUP45_13095 [Thalassospira xiamenensis]MCD1595238.1 ABC transporter permease [Thalassospira xiamenensis]
MKKSFNTDLKLTIERPTSWLHLSLNDIQSKYRRTRLGPWWIVIGMSITLGMMAVLWSVIFGLDWRHYLPYMLTGVVVWYWLSGYVTAACNVFSMEFGGMIRSMPSPPMIYAFRFVARGFFLHLHNMVIPIAALVITGTIPHWSLVIWLPLSSIIILINAFFITIYLGFLCARVRDLAQLVQAVMGPLMLLTPAMWNPDMLGNYRFLAELNPFTHFLAIVRSPLIGDQVSLLSIIVVGCITIFNVIVGVVVYNKFRGKLVFWL